MRSIYHNWKYELVVRISWRELINTICCFDFILAYAVTVSAGTAICMMVTKRLNTHKG
jgi:hypothetical protein